MTNMPFLLFLITNCKKSVMRKMLILVFLITNCKISVMRKVPKQLDKESGNKVMSQNNFYAIIIQTEIIMAVSEVKLLGALTVVFAK